MNGRVLIEGYVYNPLKGYARNGMCLCGSGKKFKKCHLDLIPEAITTARAVKITLDLKNLDLKAIQEELSR